MKFKYRLFRRQNGMCFWEDRENRQQGSLHTKEKTQAVRLLNAKNESLENPFLNRQIARTYLTVVDPEIVKRDWRYCLTELIKTKQGENSRRWGVFAKDRTLKSILDRPLIETRPEHFLGVLHAGGVSTNVFLRRLHNSRWICPWRLG
jgi:hypothetical protein